jgi:RHS repeat-associated protein
VRSPFRLLGQIADDELGLCFTRYRLFDPEAGRWLSPDPLGIDGGSNLYAFDGAPTLVVDPRGLSSGTSRGRGHEGSDPPPPERDQTGKVHGQLPSNVPESWTREQREDAAAELEGSVARRQQEQIDMGEDPVHRERIRQEQQLLRQLNRSLD